MYSSAIIGFGLPGHGPEKKPIRETSPHQWQICPALIVRLRTNFRYTQCIYSVKTHVRHMVRNVFHSWLDARKTSD
jgi:hypothetical protein